MASRRTTIVGVVVLVAVLVAGVATALITALSRDSDRESTQADPATSSSGDESSLGSSRTPTSRPSSGSTSWAGPRPVPVLPGGGRRVFAGGRFLVAYYGTAGTGSLGVLGEAGPDQIMDRLRRAARPFAGPGRPAQPVYELIATVVQGSPGADGSWSNDIGRDDVRRYVKAAHRNQTMLVLDLQPGRSDFLTVAKRWAWALKDPWVGLALDPEWRMAPGQRPGQQLGSVDAAEVNRVSAWLDRFTARNRLPQKAFVLHQFRTSMVRDIARIADRPHLAQVQHVDGYGTRGQKLATYHTVARPSQFVMGFKLFYDEDVDMMDAARVLRIRPRVRFVSFQ